MVQLKFGTDGWRGVIGREFTFENARRVCHAACVYFADQAGRVPRGVKLRLLCIGYDNRFLSPEIAQMAAEQCAAAGFIVKLSDTAISTPALSVAIMKEKAVGGLMVTASHNPYYFNGIKVRTYQGVSAPNTDTARIESIVTELTGEAVAPEKIGSVQKVDFRKLYLSHLGTVIDRSRIIRKKSKLVIDAMHGSAAGLVETFLSGKSIQCVSVRSQRDPLFGLVNPEPIAENLSVLKTAVAKERASIGMAFDGDGDRIGLVDGSGRFVNSHHIFALLLLHLAEHRKWKGPVARTVSGSFLIERICKRFGLEMIETPIGFKYISETLLESGALIGGEESGGIACRGYIPERDGVYAGLLVMEYLSRACLTLSQAVDALHERFGVSVYERNDVIIDKPVNSNECSTVLGEHHHKVFGKKNCRIVKTDGIKFVFEDDSWVLIRASGTEPVLRYYAEGSSEAQVKKLLESAFALVRVVKLI